MTDENHPASRFADPGEHAENRHEHGTGPEPRRYQRLAGPRLIGRDPGVEVIPGRAWKLRDLDEAAA